MAKDTKIMKQLSDCRLIDIPKICDAKGNLSVLEQGTLPFAIKRVFFLYDIPSHAKRLGHSHYNLQQVLVALSGSFKVVLHDGTKECEFTLNKPYVGLYIPSGIWREIHNFSSGAVCLTIASEPFDEQDYIRDFREYQLFKNRVGQSIVGHPHVDPQ